MENAFWNGQLYTAADISESYELENTIRKASNRKELRCPDPDCPSPVLRYCHGEIRGAFFAHLSGCACDYVKFDKENTDQMRKVKRIIYNSFVNQGYNVKPDVKLLPRHYTHLLFTMLSGKKIAVELGTQQTTANSLDNLSEQYASIGCDVKWIVISDLQTPVKENETFFIKRYQLNKSKRKDVLVLNWEGTEIAQSIVDPNEYLHEGHIIHSENYPEIYSETAGLDALTFEEEELTIQGFHGRYNEWLTKKKRAFDKRIAQIEEEEKRKQQEEAEQKRKQQEEAEQKRKQQEETEQKRKQQEEAALREKRMREQLEEATRMRERLEEVERQQREMAARAKRTANEIFLNKLAYALKEYKTDEELISYLQSIDDETVKFILKGPSNMVREKIAKTFTDGLYTLIGNAFRSPIQNEQKEAKRKSEFLIEKLEYALEYKTEDEMISYLQSIYNEAVKDILKVHPFLVRGKLAITVMNWFCIWEENYISKTFPNRPKTAECVPKTLLECKDGKELISYLQSIDDEAVNAILKAPSPDVDREVEAKVSADWNCDMKEESASYWIKTRFSFYQ